MGIPDPEASRQHLEAWKGRIDRLAADTQEMSTRFGELKAVGADPDGLVRVTVDSSGNMVDVQLSERTRRIDTEYTGRAILAAVAAARAQMAEASAQIISETLGSDSAAGQAIADRVRSQLMPQSGEEG
ncbi:YbaB/EbfC family nucleoid-associated protein [Glycomyces terrestris]|nr:YbaB/EbfC family nucleoid-associated protein [Glycomyces terrestris]